MTEIEVVYAMRDARIAVFSMLFDCVTVGHFSLLLANDVSKKNTQYVEFKTIIRREFNMSNYRLMIFIQLCPEERITSTVLPKHAFSDSIITWLKCRECKKRVISTYENNSENNLLI